MLNLPIQGTLLFVIWLIFLVPALQKIGIENGPILAAAGIVGLAVGFGIGVVYRENLDRVMEGKEDMRKPMIHPGKRTEVNVCCYPIIRLS